MSSKQWLPRGTVIGKHAIRKLVVSGDDWQIYITGDSTYTLAIGRVLYDKWALFDSVVESIFIPWNENSNVMVFASRGSFLISSLEKGPYPTNYSQVEAFAVAFRNARDGSPHADFRGAIYLEEYSILLPINEDDEYADNGLAFGQWITSGVGVSITDIESVKNLTTWLPEQILYKTAEIAEFEIEKKTAKAKDDNEIESSRNADGIPNERFELIGRKELEAFINEHIVDVLRKPDEYKRMGIGFPGATVLYGPPGSGKTFAIEKLSEYLNWPRYDINSNSIGSPYIHETGKKIAQIFDEAIQNAPAIIIIDEMESYLSAREGREQHHVEEVAEFLRKIPEAIENHVLVFAMTNILDRIDPAILRRGRFDYIIEVGLAGKEEILGLLEAKAKDLPIDKDVVLSEVADRLSEHPLSDVTFVLREAGRDAVKNGLATITNASIERALEMVMPKKEKKIKSIGFIVD